MLPMCAFRDFGIGRKKIGAATLLLVALSSAYPLAAWSQTLPEEALEQVVPPPARNWDITLGTGLAESPIYPGAKRYHAHPLFFGSISYRNLAFLGPAGLGVGIINSNGFRAGPVIGYEGGRSSSDDPHLKGLGNLEPSIMAARSPLTALGPSNWAAPFAKRLLILTTVSLEEYNSTTTRHFLPINSI